MRVRYLVLWGALAVVTETTAQSPGDKAVDGLLVTAAKHIQAKEETKEFNFDPRFADKRHSGFVRSWTGDMPDRSVRALEAVQGLTSKRLEQVFRCAEENPRSCRLDGTSAFVSFTAPEFKSVNEATVYVEVTRITKFWRHPVEVEFRELRFTRNAKGVWAVTADNLLAST